MDSRQPPAPSQPSNLKPWSPRRDWSSTLNHEPQAGTHGPGHQRSHAVASGQDPVFGSLGSMREYCVRSRAQSLGVWVSGLGV